MGKRRKQVVFIHFFFVFEQEEGVRMEDQRILGGRSQFVPGQNRKVWKPPTTAPARHASGLPRQPQGIQGSGYVP